MFSLSVVCCTAHWIELTHYADLWTTLTFCSLLETKLLIFIHGHKDTKAISIWPKHLSIITNHISRKISLRKTLNYILLKGETFRSCPVEVAYVLTRVVGKG